MKGHTNNPYGRPANPENEYIRKAIEEVGEEKKKTLWRHAIERAYESDTVLISIVKKFIPDRQATELINEGGDIVIHIEKKYNGKEESDQATGEKEDIAEK